MQLKYKNMLRNVYADLRTLVTSENGQRRNSGRVVALFVAFYLFKKERPEANNVNICEK